MRLTSVPIPDYAEPFHWWGHDWQARSPLTLMGLVAGGMLSKPEADYLVGALDEGRSLAVVSDASGAGKSTLLWALAASMRRHVSRVYIRGQYEPFAFSLQPGFGSPPLLLMINEVSPFLPVYCWGRVRDRLFGPEFSGIQKVATGHSSSLEAFLDQLNTLPGIAQDEAIPAFEVVVFLGRRQQRGLQFRVRDIRSIS